MNKTEILALPANRETDMLVALALGWQVDEFTATSPTGSRNSRHAGDDGWLEWYTSDMNAAWKVVEKLQEEPLEFYFGINRTPAIPFRKTGKPHWHVEFGACFSYADTAPLAIVRAGLLALSTLP